MIRKRILVFPFPYLAHHLRMAKLPELVPDHNWHFAADPSGRSLLSEHSFHDFISFDHKAVLASMRKFSFGWMNRSALERVIEGQVKLIKDLQPDLIVSDAMVTSRIAAEITRVPLISFRNAYMSPYYTRIKKVPTAFPLRSIVPDRILRENMNKGEAIAMKWVQRPFNRIRKFHGLRLRKDFFQEQEADKVLLCDLPSLFPQAGLPSNYSFCGPLIREVFGNEDDVLNRLDGNKPTLVVTAGSTGDLRKFQVLNTSAFKGMNVIAAGNIFDKPADHVIQKPFIHLASVLPKADIMVCHGGNGTIYASLKAGVPVISLPSYFEQEWCSQGLEESGTGTVLSCLENQKQVQEIAITCRDNAVKLSREISESLILQPKVFSRVLETIGKSK